MIPTRAAALAALIITAAPQVAGAAEDLTLSAPTRSTIWVEGEAASITWQASGQGALCIGIAMGGKDMGLLNDCDTQASAGRFTWTIPEGRFTDFGVDPARDVRVMLTRADGRGTPAISPPFMVAARRPPAVTSPEDAIRQFYALLADDPRAAHALLSPFRITLEVADGSKVSHGPRPAFVDWQASGIDSIARVDIEALEDVSQLMHWAREAEPMLGIRRFLVSLVETRKDGSRVARDYFIDVAAGYLDAAPDAARAFRILSIGTGP